GGDAQAVGREDAGRRCAGGRRAGAGREEMRKWPDGSRQGGDGGRMARQGAD
ncbi:hypothetical protein ACLOJK_000528, partial [Asimina triloba]